MNETLNTQQSGGPDIEAYRNFFEKIDQAFCIIELKFDENQEPYDYVFLDVNPAFEEQTGIKDATGKTIRELTPNIENYWPKIYGEIVRTGESRRFKESSEALGRDFDVNAFRLGGPESRKVAIIFSDITEKKKAEEALQKQIQATNHERKILHNFFMQAPAAFCILKGPNHIFELANPDYLQLVGNRDVLGKTVAEALPEVVGQGFTDLLDNVFKTGEPFIGKEVEVMVDKGKGVEQTFLDFIYQPYKDVSENSEGILVFAYDITAHVNARRELQQAYDDLEIKVTFRNIELERLNKEKTEKIAELERELEQLRAEKA
jgi:PAS domain S-box-containing protein